MKKIKGIFFVEVVVIIEEGDTWETEYMQDLDFRLWEFIESFPNEADLKIIDKQLTGTSFDKNKIHYVLMLTCEYYEGKA
jgi:hypothetical protein